MSQININYNEYGPIVSTKEQYEKYYNERFIYPSEYEKIVNILSDNEDCRILITGLPGTGKTTLLMLLSRTTENSKDIHIIPGDSIPNDYSTFFEHCGNCIFIDGIDRVDNPYALLSYLNSCGVKKIVCTSQAKAITGITFSHIVNLEPLTYRRAKQFLEMLSNGSRGSHPLFSKIKIEPGKHDLLTPRSILKLIIENNDNSTYEEFFSKYNSFIYKMDKAVDFGTDGILHSNEFYIPSREIINGINIIKESLLKQAHKNPQVIHNFTPREFEMFVSEFLDKQGYEVKLTKQTRDGGKDLIVVQKSFLGEFSIYVECKKYDSRRPINVGLIRELYGTIMADAITAGMLITTSHFTKDAKNYTEKIKHRMSLIDFNDLVKALTSIVT